MNETLEDIADALDEVSAAIVKGWGGDNTLKENWGYHHPSLTRHDLAEMADLLAAKIRECDGHELPDAVQSSVDGAARQIRLLMSETIPQFYSGNGWQAVPAYMATLVWLEMALEPVLSWQAAEDPSKMPPKVARRVRAMSARLDEIAPETDALEEKIKLINEATEAADSLPTDMEELRKARTQIENLSSESATTQGKIKQRWEEIEKLLVAMSQKSVEADKLVKQTEEAYRVATSIGLAGAFDQRSRSLSWSMRWWVAGLMIALGGGTAIGANRVQVLTEALSSSSPNWGIIWIHIILSVVSIGAPLWFAWLATKQIGQRFRLAEDYGYKASVAKAYEGYRKEAARIDEDFESRLFDSALTRLEEAPLRLVEDESHGSPWHELINSDAFKAALNKVPDLGATLDRIGSKAGQKGKSSDVQRSSDED
ncbi:hypothetical protein [Luteimonas granuli]|uniref:Uncharacterized protein n=1 Tax=Luteimonas granuli TaxID=1176533 RepID=A0A518N437_9GAMM|nr:hypothetical protein [Luteimonas granuli]QDW66696.1 hypothetical protein FPZ22_07155 [Luteimonas granuli]